MKVNLALFGAPNSGKTTLFNFLTEESAPVMPFPFTTTKPFSGRLIIKDSDLAKLSLLVNSELVIEMCHNVTDFPALVKNSFSGEGLGSNFLEYGRDANVIGIVVRGCAGLQEDTSMIENELRLADIRYLSSEIKRSAKNCFFRHAAERTVKGLANNNIFEFITREEIDDAGFSGKLFTIKKHIRLIMASLCEDEGDLEINQNVPTFVFDTDMMSSSHLQEVALLRRCFSKFVSEILGVGRVYTVSKKVSSVTSAKPGSTIATVLRSIHLDLGNLESPIRLININEIEKQNSSYVRPITATLDDKITDGDILFLDT